MAKVELVKQEEKNPEWVPFVTLTLSKREAAGLVKELGPYPYSVTPFSLFNSLEHALGSELEDSPRILHRDVAETTLAVEKYLNEKFGPV